MRHTHTRIIRNRKSDGRQMTALGHLLGLCARAIYRPQIQANLNYLQELKADESKLRAQVAEARKQKIANDVVLGDLRIEQEKIKLELLKAMAAAKGIGGDDFAPPSHYESEDQQGG